MPCTTIWLEMRQKLQTEKEPNYINAHTVENCEAFSRWSLYDDTATPPHKSKPQPLISGAQQFVTVFNDPSTPLLYHVCRLIVCLRGCKVTLVALFDFSVREPRFPVPSNLSQLIRSPLTISLTHWCHMWEVPLLLEKAVPMWGRDGCEPCYGLIK